MAIGSAIASDKEILIFDEPTSGLDYEHMLEVSEIIKHLKAEEEQIKSEFLKKECCDYLILENGKLYGPGAWTRKCGKKW